jgi:hypothetical protein
MVLTLIHQELCGLDVATQVGSLTHLINVISILFLVV